MSKTPLSFPPLTWLLGLVYLMILFRTAWVGDDAFITFRTVENLVNGYGPVYNIGERVQSFTHPLWMFLLAGVYYVSKMALGISIPGHLYLISIFLSILLSVLAVALLVRAATSMVVSLWATLILMLSQAFVDYSTSGLENPLIHLLFALFYIIYSRYLWLGREVAEKYFFWLYFIAALTFLTRQDTILFFAPVLLVEFFQAVRQARQTWRPLLAMCAGIAPSVLWELFALLYYGFPFPNTYYAKLDNGLRVLTLVEQGSFYLTHSLSTDPMTALGLVFCGILALVYTTHRQATALLLTGVALYLLYVVRIGGDFMAGRLLSAPLLASVFIFATFTQLKELEELGSRAVTVGLLLIGLAAPHPTLLSDANYGHEVTNLNNLLDHVDIADERGFYYKLTGLLRRNSTQGQYAVYLDTPGELDQVAFGYTLVNRAHTDVGGTFFNYPESHFAYRRQWYADAAPGQPGRASQRVQVVDVLGIRGYRLGPAVHIVDVFALTDPLLARLPVALQYRATWRIGHLQRTIPAGYIETLTTAEVQLEDPALAEYYTRLSIVIRGTIWNPARLVEIWKLNTGHYNHLLPHE